MINSFGNPSVKINVSNGFDFISISESEFSKFVKHANRRIHENQYGSLKEYWDDKDNFPIADSVIVIDDETFVESSEFAAFVNADKYNYYIIINRTQLAKISDSMHEVYTLKTSGRLHWLERRYDSPVDGYDLNNDSQPDRGRCCSEIRTCLHKHVYACLFGKFFCHPA